MSCPSRNGSLRYAVEQALGEFGNDILTVRESEIVHLLLRGYSAKLASKQLGISHETARVHRRHAYAKLRISSQVELFHLFIGSLPGTQPMQDPILSLEELGKREGESVPD